MCAHERASTMAQSILWKTNIMQTSSIKIWFAVALAVAYGNWRAGVECNHITFKFATVTDRIHSTNRCRRTETTKQNTKIKSDFIRLWITFDIKIKINCRSRFFHRFITADRQPIHDFDLIFIENEFYWGNYQIKWPHFNCVCIIRCASSRLRLNLNIQLGRPLKCLSP